MLAVAVLAAGKGTRMRSSLPKVVHPLAGRSLVERVLESAAILSPHRQLVIVGYESDRVRAELSHLSNLEFVEQTEQLGTGHAVQQLLPHLKDFEGDLLVLNGDVPLLRPETLTKLVHTHRSSGSAATVLTAQLPDPTGYGRVFCDDQGILKEIIEHRDCTPAQRQNHRINGGIYCFNWAKLAQALPQLSDDNDQQEYYLTDVVKLMAPVMAMDVADFNEIQGINNRKQLSVAYDILQNRIRDRWMIAGVMMHCPETITIDETVELTADVILEPQTHLRGNTVIEAGCRIGPGCLLENSRLEENVTVLQSVISDSVVKANTRIGPYAHLRGHADIGADCRIGNFVEVKKSQVGDRTNIAHLSYIGDASLGTKVNVGAGTVTANYDGYQKHKTTIGDRTKTGSNSVLVAPINVGKDVTIGAGSVISKDVSDDCLVVARAKQREIPGWQPKTAPKD